VLDEALTGAPTRAIAERLTLSEATVRSHLSRIYVKLGVSGRVALLAAFREACPTKRHEPPAPTAANPTAAHPTAAFYRTAKTRLACEGQHLPDCGARSVREAVAELRRLAL